MAQEGSAEDFGFENDNNSEDRINMMVNTLILEKLGEDPFEMDERVESMMKMNPIGLRLQKTPQLVNSVEMAMQQPDKSKEKKEKLKACNFPASFLKIGDYTVLSENEGDLVAKCYFAKRKLVWEVLDLSVHGQKLKRKIEIQWCDISAIGATVDQDQLQIEVGQIPRFYVEQNPQPRKHTIWSSTGDFTQGEASAHRRHCIIFPKGTLERPYLKLLQADIRLYHLSLQPFPSSPNPYLMPMALYQHSPIINNWDTDHNPFYTTMINQSYYISPTYNINTNGPTNMDQFAPQSSTLSYAQDYTTQTPRNPHSPP